MYYRLIPFAAALALAGVGIAQQSKPSEAAKSFSLDALEPTPTASPSPEAVPTALPTPAGEPRLASPTVPATDTLSAPPSAPLSVPPPPASDALSPPPATATPPPAVRGVFTLDTPIQDLIADPGAKAVLDKDLPGVSDDENLDKFKALSLRSFQSMTGGQMTDAMLAKVAADLDVLAGGTGAAVAPVKVGNARHGKDDSR